MKNDVPYNYRPKLPVSPRQYVLVVCCAGLLGVLSVVLFIRQMRPAPIQATTFKNIDGGGTTGMDSATVSVANDHVPMDGSGVWMEYSCRSNSDIPGAAYQHPVLCDRKTGHGGN